ncbi:MAG: Uma2 family endonuclease [Dehalococcoidia bacterium]
MVTARDLDFIPPLENGDRLTSIEFERRYEAMPELKKAELIEGVVFLASPVSISHSRGQNTLATWLGTYAALHREVGAHSDGSVRLDPDNQFQPDIFLWKTSGGTARIGDKDILDGAPELVVEVAASSVSRDLYAKKNVYRRNGVREYIVWRVRDAEVDWFELREGDYVRREPDSDGVIESVQFPGLRLPVQALLNGDVAAVLGAVR